MALAGKKKKNRFELRMDDAMVKMIEELAKEEGVSKAEMVETCIRHYYTEDVLDENLILGRMSTLEKKIDWLNNKTETFYKLAYAFMQYVVTFLPALPKDKTEAQGILDSGAERFSKFVMKFRKIEKAEDISFVQQVWGDTQETLEETYMRSK